MIKEKNWYLRISSHTAVQRSIVTSYSIGVDQWLSKHRCLCEIEVFIHWIFVDFALKTSIKHKQVKNKNIILGRVDYDKTEAKIDDLADRMHLTRTKTLATKTTAEVA